MLAAAEAVRDRSAGAFDIAVGPLTSLWRQARRSGRLPRPDKLAAARAAVGAGTVELVPATQSVRLPKPDTRLDPGGIGMGYAADRALEVLAARGIDSAMIDASGDVRVSAAPPGTTGWRIAVARCGPVARGDTRLVAGGRHHVGRRPPGRRDRRSPLQPYRRSTDRPGGHRFDRGQRDRPRRHDRRRPGDRGECAGEEAGPTVVAAFPGCAARFTWREERTDRVLTTPGWPGEPPRP